MKLSLWVKAFTSFAVFRLDVSTTTIPTIIFTPAIVVSVIAPTVSFIFRKFTRPFTCRFVIWVKAFTSLAVLLVDIRTTTIPTIIVTPAIVVSIVAIVVSFILLIFTRPITCRRRWTWAISTCIRFKTLAYIK